MSRRPAAVLCAKILVALPVFAGQPQPGAEKFTPAETSLFLSFRGTGRLYDDVAKSQFWTKFRTLPGILMLRMQLNQFLEQAEEYQLFVEEHGDLIASLQKLLREEASVVVPNESTEDFAKFIGCLYETVLAQEQLKQLKPEADAGARAALQKQTADAWKKLLEVRIPSIALVVKTGAPEALPTLKSLFSLMKRPEDEETDFPFVSKFTSSRHKGVTIETVAISLSDDARADAVDNLDLEDILPADAARALIKDLLDRYRQGFEINYAQSGGYCLISLCSDKKLLTELIDRQKAPEAETLVKKAEFAPLLEMMDGDVFSVAFIDTKAWGPAYNEHLSPLLVPLLDVLDRQDPDGDMLEPLRDQITMLDRVLAVYPKAIKFGGFVTVRDKGLLSRGFLKLDPAGAKELNKAMRDARFGHASVLELRNKKPKLLKLMPADVLLCSIDVNIDPAAHWANLSRVIDQWRPAAARIAPIKKRIDILDKYDKFVQANVLPKMGREMGVFIARAGELNTDQLPGQVAMLQGVPSPGLCIAVEALDAPGLRKAMKDLVVQINGDLLANEVPFEVELFTPEQYKGVEIQKLLIDLGKGFQPCYAVVHGFFVVATAPELVRKMIDTGAGGKSIAMNPRYRELPDIYREELMRMQFVDTEVGFEELKTLVRFGFKVAEAQVQTPEAGQEQLGMAMMMASIKTTLLQGLDCLKVIKCSGGCTWAEGDTIQARGRIRVIDLPKPADATATPAAGR